MHTDAPKLFWIFYLFFRFQQIAIWISLLFILPDNKFCNALKFRDVKEVDKSKSLTRLGS